MAKSEVKVVVSGDIHPLEKAFKEAQEKARELGKQLGEVGSDLGKGIVGFDIGKALGIGGAVYAAGKLGEALIDAAKEGYKEFQQYQDAVLKFKYNLPKSEGSLEERGKKGAELAEYSSQQAGVFTEEQLNTAQLALLNSAKVLRESPEKLQSTLTDMRNIAVKIGSTPGDIAENFKNLTVGSTDEKGTAMKKFYKATPGLEDETLALRDQRAAEYSGSGRKDKAEEISGMSAAEFMTQEGKDKGGATQIQELIDILHKSAPAGIEKEKAAIEPQDALIASLLEVKQAFGGELKPVIDDLINTFTMAMPIIKDDFMALAEVLKLAIPVVTFFAEVIAGLNEIVDIIIRTINAKLADWLGINKATNDAAAVSEGVDKRLSEGGGKTAAGTVGNYTAGLYFGGGTAAKTEAEEKPEGPSKADRDSARKEDLDAAKTILKMQQDSASSLRSLNLDAASQALHEQARNAAHAMLARIVPGDDSESAKKIATESELAAKIIGIKEEAQQKLLKEAADSEQKIANIKSEQAKRDLDRGKENKEDISPIAERARNAKRADEDNASASAIADLQVDAAQRIRDANQDAADKIIDAQEESAKSQRDTIIAAYNEAVSKKEGPYKFTADEGPMEEETYSTWGKGGTVHEGSFERKRREKANKEGQEAVDRANEAYQKQKEQSDLAGVQGVKYDQSGLGAALNVTASYDPKTGTKSDTNPNFEFSKGAGEQAKTTLVLEAIYKVLAGLTGALAS